MIKLRRGEMVHWGENNIDICKQLHWLVSSCAVQLLCYVELNTGIIVMIRVMVRLGSNLQVRA